MLVIVEETLLKDGLAVDCYRVSQSPAGGNPGSRSSKGLARQDSALQGIILWIE